MGVASQHPSRKNKSLIMDIASLNKKFGIGSELGFKEIAAGITAIEIDTALATASISLMGGQVLTWHFKKPTRTCPLDFQTRSVHARKGNSRWRTDMLAMV